MKQKQDFVTNSSSCSYIVCIPDIDKCLKELKEKIEVTEFIENAFINSKYHGNIYFGEYGISNETFNEIVNTLEKYIIFYIDSGSEDVMEFLNISYNDENKNKLNKILGEK